MDNKDSVDVAQPSHEDVGNDLTCNPDVAPESKSDDGQHSLDEEPHLRRYKFTNFDDVDFTISELVEMEFTHDDRWQRLRKRELPQEFWDARRMARNKRRSQRHKDTKRRRAQERDKTCEVKAQELGVTVEEMAKKEAAEARRVMRQREARIDAAMKNGMKIIVDCSFSLQCNDREQRSLLRQLCYCLAANKQAENPASLTFCGFTGPIRAFGESKMGSQGWKAHLKENGAMDEIQERDNVVVLSPDAEEVITDIDPSKVYVIGGLVDRTVKKGETRSFAETGGFPAFRLPCKEHFGSNLVLNVNDVVALLLLVRDGMSWSDALDKVVPPRQKERKEKSTEGVKGRRRKTSDDKDAKTISTEPNQGDVI